MVKSLMISIEKTSLTQLENRFVLHIKQQIEWQTILNTPGGIFKTGHTYAFHIQHQKAVPVDKPVTLQWNLNQNEQRDVCTLLFAKALRKDPRRLGTYKKVQRKHSLL
jgi:hypothetical protein